MTGDSRADGESLLSIRGLRVRYRGPAGAEVEAVRGVDLDVRPGEAVGLFGASGCGKSSLAFGAFSLLPPAAQVEGRVFFDGERIDGAPARRLRNLHGRRVGFVFQQPSLALHPLRTVGGQLIDVLRTHTELGRRARRDRAVELFLELELGADHLRARPHQLSGGQQQRALFAIAVAGEPALLVADEPTAALDSETAETLLRRIDALRRRRGLALLWISHDPGVLEGLCDRVAVLHGGRLVETGPPRELFREPAHAATREVLRHRTGEKPDGEIRGGEGRAGQVRAD
ncbi:MAG: ABC transporter ATP-binding protein [Acidobacteriota bacterium]